MNRLLVLLPAAALALSSAPVFAQDAPEGAYKDLWCGIAFISAMKDAPFSEEDVAAARAAGDTATEEQLGLIAQADMRDQFVTGGTGLVDKATAAYKEAGFTDESFGTVRTELEPKVVEQISGSGETAEFQFEECVALLPSDPMAAPAQ
jgi:hypothetical protein